MTIEISSSDYAFFPAPSRGSRGRKNQQALDSANAWAAPYRRRGWRTRIRWGQGGYYVTAESSAL